MFVRITTLTGAANIAAAVDYTETKARPAVEAMAGHRGLAVLTNEGAGSAVVVAYWDTPEHLEASAGAVSKMRESIVDIAGGGELVVEVFEAAVTKRWSMPSPGAIARFLRVEATPAEIETAVAFWADEALPAFAGATGIVSAQLLVDRASGKLISITGWQTQTDLDAVKPILSRLMERVTGVAPSVRATGIEQYTLVSTTAQLGT